MLSDGVAIACRRVGPRTGFVLAIAPTSSRPRTSASTSTTLAAARLGRCAGAALYRELALEPKPGLVSLRDNGSHRDMDAGTFLRSIAALRGYFPAMADLGARHAPFADLEAAGIAAEARMLSATGGINTHRGAIFLLGLLCAAGGGADVDAADGDPALRWRDTLTARWGPSLAARAAARRPTQAAAARHGLRDAGAEAASGFPIVFDVAWPAWRRASVAGLDDRHRRLQVLFETMAVLDDTNLVHRGGLDGLRFAQRRAVDFLRAGGAARADAIDHARAIHAGFVARRLSPGGAADVLAATDLLAHGTAASTRRRLPPSTAR